LLQFLSAPNILHDIHELENDLGGRLDRVGPAAPGGALYLCALERGFLDGIFERLAVEPLARLSARLDRFDRRLCSSLPEFLGRAERERESDGD
ncbi:MAG: hypothetical protein AAB578_05580, partial [Elusimicrobiota bacterium]